MSKNTYKIYRYEMQELNKPFVLVESTSPEIKADEALVKVAGCGVCHTDIGFWHNGVRTKKILPLTLGHEISGTVLDGPDYLIGKNVIVPAVLPCGECELCKKGRSNICQNQLMPGNDFHGGFASHIVVPYRNLCVVPDKVLENYSLQQLAVVADAISTPYQVMKKSELEPGDLAIIVGVGGVGVYGAMLAVIFGAKVIAIDIDDAKLEKARSNGVHAVINSKDLSVKEIKAKVKALSGELNTSPYGWKIFEMSGSTAGQELAFNLITYASVLSVVGFTMNKLELRLSNLMAFDAKLVGTWGCKPELYPDVVELIASGKLKINDFVELFPMSEINKVFENALSHQYTKRSVLVPDFEN